eukprot:380170-Pelagomonas_calceolata.AAC.2
MREAGQLLPSRPLGHVCTDPVDTNFINPFMGALAGLGARGWLGPGTLQSICRPFQLAAEPTDFHNTTVCDNPRDT